MIDLDKKKIDCIFDLFFFLVEFCMVLLIILGNVWKFLLYL